MFLKFFIDIIIFLISSFVNLVHLFLPTFNFNNDLHNVFLNIMSVTSQAGNFMYFIFGDVLFVIIPFLYYFLFARFVALPIISVVRGWVRFGRLISIAW